MQLLEAALFASTEPLSLAAIKKSLYLDLTLDQIQEKIECLQAFYADRGIHLVQVASGYRFEIAPHLNVALMPLLEGKKNRFSKAFMETAAIIAYRQPVTRGEIEAIRGVAVSSGIMQTLVELEWVRIVAYKEVPGKPALYATTKKFLDHFKLSSLDILPDLRSIESERAIAEAPIEPPIESQTKTETETETQTALQIETMEIL